MKKEKVIKRTVRHLTELIKIHSHLYYCKDDSVISDIAFDHIEKALELIDSSAKILHLVGAEKCGRKKCAERLLENNAIREKKRVEVVVETVVEETADELIIEEVV